MKAKSLKTLKTSHVYVVDQKDWSWGQYENKRNYFNLGWNIGSQRELEDNGVSHIRNSYYDDSGVTFRVLAYSKKEAIKKVRKYIKEKGYPVFHGLGGETDYVSLRLG